MKTPKCFGMVLSALMALVLCGTALAVPDDVVIVTATGTFTLNEYDLNGSGQTSFCDYGGKTVWSATGIGANGDVVWTFTDGTARVAKYNSLGTDVSAGTVGTGNGILGVSIANNGNIIFGSVDGWVYARSNTDVTSAPAGYTGTSDLLLGSGGGSYMFPYASPLDETLILGNDLGVAYLRQNADLSAVPTGYLWDGLTVGTSITAAAVLSTGDVVMASRAGNPDYYTFVRDNEDLSVAPAGYVSGNGTKMGTGSRVKAIAATGEYVVIGNDSGEVFVRHASDLVEGTIGGFTSTYTADMAAYSGIAALTVTSNNNVIIGLHDGRFYVRSLFDIDGADIVPMTTRYTGSQGILGVYAIPEPMTLSLIVVGGLIGLRRRRR